MLSKAYDLVSSSLDVPLRSREDLPKQNRYVEHDPLVLSARECKSSMLSPFESIVKSKLRSHREEQGSHRGLRCSNYLAIR